MWLSKEQKREYQEINKRCIGKRVYVLRDDNVGYYADIIDIDDYDNFLVKKNDGRISVVSMWSVRYTHDNDDD